MTVRRVGDRVLVPVADTGLGPGAVSAERLGAQRTGGTDLAKLPERLALALGGDATLALAANTPRRTLATLDLPATGAAGA